MDASSAGPDAVQRLIDRQAITDVILAYCRNVDLVRPAEIAALFTENCVVDYGPGLGAPTAGSAELERRLATGLPRFAATSHHVSNIEVDFDDAGDAATTITYLYVWHRYDDGRPDAHLWARYHDRFVRTPAGWRIAERTLRVAGQQDFDVEWHPIGRATDRVIGGHRTTDHGGTGPMATLTAPFAAERGDEPALIDEAGTTTWRQFDERVDRVVNGLRAAGLAPGDTLAVVLGNRREWFEVAMACAHGGWTYVPVNWHWVGDELAYVLGDAGVAAVVAEVRYADAVEAALVDERAAGVRLVVAVDAPALATGGRATVDYEQLVADADAGPPEEQRLGGPMFYTSGTTGRPKGVRGSLLGNSDLPPDVMSLVAGSFKAFFPIPGRTLLCGPFYHSAQYAFSFLPLVAGSSVVMQHKYDAAGVLELIDRHGVTNVHLVPTQMKRLVDLPDAVRAGFDGSSLALVLHGVAPCSPAVKRALIDWWGPRITEYYGSTEGSVVSMITSEEWLAKGGSVGRPVDTVDVLVVDADGNEVPPGQEGTLYFRSKVGMTFEYHNDPDKTAAVHLQPGVATSGDVGYLDADGYLWLSDRRIDMIISGGVNIYPAEIEGVLQGHPSVADAAVIGVPDEEYGEQVKAVVVPADGVAPGDELTQRLIAHCRQHLAGYKAPKTIDYVAEIPRSAAGKIQKQPLREPYWAGHDRRI